MSVLTAPSDQIRFAGFPLPAWGFALRTWLAMVIALYAAFWLQLESASSAAVCVGILALPTRGQALEKAFWRLLGTFIGVVASIVIVGTFNQLREPMILAFAGWLALCVYLGGLFDGNRAYGAVLSGYTVAIVAVAQIDTPQSVFQTGVNRGAALAVGVIALALVNDMFAPNLFPNVHKKLADAQGQVRAFARRVFGHGEPSAMDVGQLLQAITSIHTDIRALSGESATGPNRAAAARRATCILVQEVGSIRAVAALLDRSGADDDQRQDLIAAFEDRSGARAALLARVTSTLKAASPSDTRMLAAGGIHLLLERDCAADRAIADLQSGHGRRKGPRLAIYRSRQSAARDALRTFCGVAAAGLLLSFADWPMVSFILLQLSAIVALSGNMPNPLLFAKIACVAFPLIAVLAGITKFLVLNGVDQFPLLAIGIAPAIIGAALISTIPDPRAFMFGFQTMVFTPVFLSPSNPQDYSPLSFLTTALLSTTAVYLLLMMLSVLLPTDDDRRRRWMMASAERDFADAVAGRGGAHGGLESAFRAADRVGQLSKLKLDDQRQHAADVDKALGLADVSWAMRRISGLLAGLQGRVGDDELASARRALSRLDPVALSGAAMRLLGHDTARGAHDRRVLAGAAMVWMASLLEHHARDIGPAAKRGTA